MHFKLKFRIVQQYFNKIFQILSFLGIWFSFSKRGSYSRNKKGKATPPKRPSNDEKETKGGAKGIGRRVSKGK